MIARTSPIALLITGLLLTHAALAHVGHLGGAFHAESLPQARALAHQEHKLIFGFVTSPGGRVSHYLESPGPQDGPMLDLLVRETIIVILDAQRDAAQLADYDLDQQPVMLLLDANGSERDRLDGNASARLLIRRLDTIFSRPDAIERARAALQERGPHDYFARERLAHALARCGETELALDHFQWCIERGVFDRDPRAIARRRLVLKAMADLAHNDSAACNTVLDCRDMIAAIVLSYRPDPILARDLSDLNHWLAETPHSLALFDRLPPGAPTRSGLFDRVFPMLIEERRYDEVLRLIDPRRAFAGEVHLASRRIVHWASGRDAPVERGTRAFAVARGAALVEALAGVKRTSEAQHLIDDILAFDQSTQTRHLLLNHTKRSGNVPTLNYLQARLDATNPAPLSVNRETHTSR